MVSLNKFRKTATNPGDSRWVKEACRLVCGEGGGWLAFVFVWDLVLYMMVELKACGGDDVLV